jgi:hypothetical protein
VVIARRDVRTYGGADRLAARCGPIQQGREEAPLAGIRKPGRDASQQSRPQRRRCARATSLRVLAADKQIVIWLASKGGVNVRERRDRPCFPRSATLR